MFSDPTGLMVLILFGAFATYINIFHLDLNSHFNLVLLMLNVGCLFFNISRYIAAVTV